MKNKNWACLSSFILKIIAFVTMTFDHVGWALQNFIGENYIVAIIFRCIGRIALPLFCFMIAEGMVHSKNKGNYLLRLGIMATIISGAQIFVEYMPWFNGFSLRREGNIFIDLLLGGLGVYLLDNKNKYIRPLAIIPFAISVASFFARCLEQEGTMIIHWYPFFLRCQYHFYSVGMIMSFYLGKYLKNLFIKQYSNNSGIPVESIEGTLIERYAANLISMGILIFWTLLFLITAFALPAEWLYWNPLTQTLAILSGAFILLYSGRRGYNAKWFQYGSYFYYPIHLLIIFGIVSLL